MTDFLEVQINMDERPKDYKSFHTIYQINKKSTIQRWVLFILSILIIVLFLPWTQNIRAKGIVTTLRPEQRPQQLNSIIAGRVIKWHVKEGDYVKEGDTVLQLGEVKVDYMDPELLSRTKEQISSKQLSADGYISKANTAATQVIALQAAREAKLNQLDIKIRQQGLKIQSDSTELNAVNNELNVAKRQIDAAMQMLDSGVISLVDFERRKVTYQNTTAKQINAANKLTQSRQELSSLYIEKNGVVQDYTDKISKAEGDRFASFSGAASAEADISKLENLYASYDIRNKLYYVRAPQSGQVIQSKKAGIGEMVKEGDMIVEIVPDHFDYAVEMFVEPMDQPLIMQGQIVQFVFDGFPAIVFSGWPAASYGTFSGKVIAVENNANKSGKFRVLVSEDSVYKPWPKQLRMGGGANGIALLKNVSIWYELWRQINGFPPDYYKTDASTTVTKK